MWRPMLSDNVLLGLLVWPLARAAAEAGTGYGWERVYGSGADIHPTERHIFCPAAAQGCC